MIKTFDMQFIRYINLFEKVTRVGAKHCFSYNNGLVFIVPQNLVHQAIGRDNSNLKKLSQVFEKKIRIVAEPFDNKDLTHFVSTLVSPIEFDKIEIVETESGEKEAVITTSNRESKAMLIGRDRAREAELKNMLEQYFGVKNLRIN